MSNNLLKIDGSMMEGGGAIVRMAVAFAAIYQQPVEIRNIRANRSNPGLRNQHMHVIKTIKQLTGGRVEGLSVGSKRVRYYPQKIQGEDLEIDIGTAGSITLLLLAILPVAIFANKTVKLLVKGGTDVKWSPPVDYFRYVYLPFIEKIGVDTVFCLGRRGHYPKGGGKVTLDIEPVAHLGKIDYEKTKPLEIENISGRAHAVKLPCSICDRMISTAKKLLKEKDYSVNIIQKECPEPKYDTHVAPGAGITLWATTNYGTVLAGDGLGEKGLPSEKVSEIAVNNLVEQLKTRRPIDYHLADQLIIWMSLLNSPSVIETTKITLHTLTNIKVAENFSKSQFSVEGKQNQPGIIRCKPKQSPLYH